MACPMGAGTRHVEGCGEDTAQTAPLGLVWPQVPAQMTAQNHAATSGLLCPKENCHPLLSSVKPLDTPVLTSASFATQVPFVVKSGVRTCRPQQRCRTDAGS